MLIPWYSGPTGQFMRLNFSVVLIVTLLALTEDVASPQQPQRVHRIGWIAFDGSRPNRDFMTRLRELGYIDGQSITVEFRSAQGSEKRLSEIAAELVRLKPEVIVANSNSATDAARKATTTIPIVFKHGDPIWDGVAGSLTQPGKSYSPDRRDLFRRAAYYVDRILEGAKPSDLPVEQPTKFELVINLNTANALGLTIPSKVLTWADRVISDGDQMPEKSVATTYPRGAQGSAKIRRIGILNVGRGNPSIDAFRQGLHELGWVEGQNIAIEYRFADGDEERLPALAAQLVDAGVDIIVSTSPRATGAARQLTKNIPIIETFVGPGLVNLDRPGRNVTGVSSMPRELGGKRLELLKEIIPRISRVSILANVANVDREPSIKEIDAVARSLGVQLQILNVKKPEEIKNAFTAMARGRVGALTVLTQAMFVLNRAGIVEFAAKSRLPAMYPDSRFTDAGGLMSYGPNNAERYRRAAYYVDKILKGAKPTELPVEQPTKFELVINLKTAKQLNLAILPKVLTWADRVIE
jgi:putative ABC transport system substrate-binding protein